MSATHFKLQWPHFVILFEVPGEVRHFHGKHVMVWGKDARRWKWEVPDQAQDICSCGPHAEASSLFSAVGEWKKGKERREKLTEGWDFFLCPPQQCLCLPVYQWKTISKDGGVKVSVTSALFEAKITTGWSESELHFSEQCAKRDFSEFPSWHPQQSTKVRCVYSSKWFSVDYRRRLGMGWGQRAGRSF